METKLKTKCHFNGFEMRACRGTFWDGVLN